MHYHTQQFYILILSSSSKTSCNYRDGGDGSLSNTLSVQTLEQEFGPYSPHSEAGYMVATVIPALRKCEREMGGSLDSLGSQPGPLGKH